MIDLERRTSFGTFTVLQCISTSHIIGVITIAKIKLLLRILGLLLNDELWVKAICWDCTSLYFNLQSGLSLSRAIIISNACSPGHHRDTERKRDFLCLLSLDRGSGLKTRKTPTITEFQILSQTISSSQFLQHFLPVIGKKRRDSWWLWCREGLWRQRIS